LDDADVQLVLTDAANADAARRLAVTIDGCGVVDVEALDAAGSDRDVDVARGPDALALIVYTSGSTGAPKGVMQTDRNVLRNTRNHTNTLHISSDERLSLLASLAAGQAPMAILGAILNGATVCPFDVKAEGFVRLADWLEREAI